MRLNDPIPTFEGATDWLNSSLESASTLAADGPTLVHFWAVSCGICKKNMPELRKLQEKYAAKGLNTLAVHMPRYEADTDMDKVTATVDEFKISEPVAIDNKHKLRDAFKNEQGWVPVYYLFDEEGRMRSRGAGEYGLGVLKQALEKMFPEEASANA